jgi:hypothetical protein
MSDMTKLETWIQRACDGTGLKVDFAFSVTCADGHQIRSVARIRNVGARNGMLVLHDYSEVRDHLECLRMAGYGFSVLDEPADDEVFDLESAMEMFRDWGWADGEQPAP